MKPRVESTRKCLWSALGGRSGGVEVGLLAKKITCIIPKRISNKSKKKKVVKWGKIQTLSHRKCSNMLIGVTGKGLEIVVGLVLETCVSCF